MKDELEKYFLGTLNEEQKNDLFNQIESDEEYKSDFIRLQNTISISRLTTQKGDKELADKTINDLQQRINQKQSRKRLRTIIKYAAFITVLLINGWFLFKHNSQQIEYTKIEAPKGQRVYLTLNDGTEVWLSSRSILRIPSQFTGKERIVELEGEGYFSVTKNENKPFIVQTERHLIKVLGTKFNVLAYRESPRFETNLIEGKVVVFDRDEPNTEIVLNAGEKVARENNLLIKSTSLFNNEDYIKNGIYSFNNKSFGEIIEYLSMLYGVRFEIKDTKKKEFLISGKFRPSEEINNILKALQGVYSFKYKEISKELIEIY